MYNLVLQDFIKIAIFGVFQSKIEFCDFEGQESQFKYDLPVFVFISYHTVFQCLLYLVHNGIGVCSKIVPTRQEKGFSIRITAIFVPTAISLLKKNAPPWFADLREAWRVLLVQIYGFFLE